MNTDLIKKEIPLLEIKNSSVLVRVGFDIPNLIDLNRVLSAKKTIQQLLENGNKVVLVSKWGRIKGIPDPKFSFSSISKLISDCLDLNEKIEFINQFETVEFNNSKESELKDLIKNAKSSLILLENTHFEEKEISTLSCHRMEIAQIYSQIATYFVDECFISSHRKEASNFEIKKCLTWAFGTDYKSETSHLNVLKENPKKPFSCIMGGAKLSTKLPLIEKMLHCCDQIILGGLLCFTFQKAVNELLESGINLGFPFIDIKDSLLEIAFVQSAKNILLKNSQQIILPLDYHFSSLAEKNLALDIGPESIELFKSVIRSSKTVFWNGPMGLAEEVQFSNGTKELGLELASNPNIYKIAGGGDTLACLDQKTRDKFNYISMGGGATLSFLSN